MKRFSTGILIFLAVLSCAAFFLPWLKLKQPWNPASRKLADSLQEQTEAKLEWHDFIGLDEFQREAIAQEPLKGATGYRLFLDLRQNSGKVTASVEASRYFVEQFLGPGTFPEKAYLLALIASLPVIVVILSLVVWKRPRSLVYLGVGLLIFYFILRWRISKTEGALLAVGMQIGAGLWLIIYSLLILALLFLGRAAFPKAKF